MIRRLLNRFLMLFLLTSLLFNCSLATSNGNQKEVVNSENRGTNTVNSENRGTYTVNRVPSQDPPADVNGNPIPANKAPQFIIIGYDDNQYDDGMYNIMNVYKDLVNPAGSGNPLTYDGAPARASFYVTPAGIDRSSGQTWQVSPETVASWKAAYDAGHEIGNHTWYHEHGLQFDVARWKDELQKCNDFIVNKVGVPRSAITGFRTPFLEYNPNLYLALKDLGFEYDNSFEGGWRYWPTENGSTLYWPFTMDSGKPAGSEARDFGNVKGLWQMPTDCVFYEDAGKISRVTGFDYNLWFSKQATKQEFVDMLKFSLNQKYSGNRSPMNFGGHTNYYSAKGLEDMKKYDPRSVDRLKSTVDERIAAVKEFLEYALTFPDVRIVTTQQALDWVKNPVPLDTAFVQHDVTVTAGANGVVEPVGVNKVVDGRSFTVNVNPDAGYMVDKFTVDGVAKTLTNNSYTINSVKAAAKIDVTFKVNPNAVLYKVNVSSGANGSFDREGLITVEQGDPLTLNIVPSEGYALDVFSIDGTPVSATFPYTVESVTKDMAITATFKHVGVEYTMTYYWTYDYKHEPVGSASDPQVDILDFNEKVIATVAKPLAERISMEGSGFLPDGTLINLYNNEDWPKARFYVVDPEVSRWGYDSQGIPLKPWKSIAVDVSVIPLNSDVFVKEFEGITLPDGTKHDGWFKAVDTSHSFSGKWIDIFCATYPDYQYMIKNFPTLNKVTVSHQAGTVYTITPSHGEWGGMWPITAVEVPEGFDKSFTFYPSDGYVVDTVLVDNTPVTVINNVYSFKNVTESHTIDVTFKKGDPIPSFDVVGTAGVGGAVSPSNTTIEKGKDVTFVITPDPGFVVDTATLNGNVVTVTGDSYIAENVQSNILFEVTFKEGLPPGGLTATYTLGTDWGTGFGASLVIKNDSDKAVSAWEVTLTFPGNQNVNGWNGIFTQEGNVVTITNTAWNGSIPPGGSVTLGMNGSYSGDNNDPTVSVK